MSSPVYPQNTVITVTTVISQTCRVLDDDDTSGHTVTGFTYTVTAGPMGGIIESER